MTLFNLFNRYGLCLITYSIGCSLKFSLMYSFPILSLVLTTHRLCIEILTRCFFPSCCFFIGQYSVPYNIQHTGCNGICIIIPLSLSLLERLGASLIILILKKNGVVQISDHTPISMIRSAPVKLEEVLASWLNRVLSKMMQLHYPNARL